MAFRYTRSSDEEGNVDIFLVRALFARLETVLSDVVAVICCEDEVRIFRYAVLVESRS